MGAACIPVEADYDKFIRLIINFHDYEQTERVEAILKRKPQYAHKMTEEGYTPLALAVQTSSINLVSLLLDYKASPNQCMRKKLTPLVVAVLKQDLRLVDLLVKRGGNFETCWLREGVTLFDYSVLAGYYEIALYFYNLMNKKELKSLEFYQTQASKLKIREIKYRAIIDGLQKGAKLSRTDYISAIQREQDCFPCLPPVYQPSDFDDSVEDSFFYVEKRSTKQPPPKVQDPIPESIAGSPNYSSREYGMVSYLQ